MSPPSFARPTLSVIGTTDRFPVRRIYTVGHNYNSSWVGRRPIMLKPSDSVMESNAVLHYPPETSQLEHEIELLIAIGRGGAFISADRALEHVYGYAIIFDLIRRDMANDLQADGLPQDIAKAFVGSSPCSPIRRVEEVGHPSRGAIWLKINGELRQEGDLADMVLSPAEIISQISLLDRIEAGDLISTGTPKKPGLLKRNDQLHGFIEGVGDLHLKIT